MDKYRVAKSGLTQPVYSKCIIKDTQEFYLKKIDS